MDEVAINPDDVILGEFLLQISERGPTAASTMWHQLKWWSKHLGLSLPLASPLLQGLRLTAEGHKVWAAPVGLPAHGHVVRACDGEQRCEE